MLIPIVIDTTALVDSYQGITVQQIDDLCDNVAKSLAARYAQQLEEEANKALHQTRRRYINAIKVIDTGRLQGTVLLDFSKDPMVSMIELGASAFDIKLGELKSPKAKIGKDGRKYITVPFRIGTPDIAGDSDVFSGSMPEDVYEVAKSQEANIKTPGGGLRSKGLVVDDLPVQYQSPGQRKQIEDSEGKVLFKEYTHKNSIYEGVTKFQDSVTGQNSYGSFRRISEGGTSSNGEKVGSDPDSWIHRGIQQYNLISAALSNFNQETETQVSLNNGLKKLGFM